MQHFAENLCLASPPVHKQHIDYYIIVFFEKQYKVGYSLVFTGNLQSAATLDAYVSAFAPLESMMSVDLKKWQISPFDKRQSGVSAARKARRG